MKSHVSPRGLWALTVAEKLAIRSAVAAGVGLVAAKVAAGATSRWLRPGEAMAINNGTTALDFDKLDELFDSVNSCDGMMVV
jgi:hypothetical protein